MAYTTQVHSYTLKGHNQNVWSNCKFYTSAFLSTTELDDEYFKPYLTRDPNAEVIYNGVVDAKEITKTHSQPNEVTLEGYKYIHENKDSRGSYVSTVYVPKNWDENHPTVQNLKSIKLGQQTSQDRYYSQKWV